MVNRSALLAPSSINPPLLFLFRGGCHVRVFESCYDVDKLLNNSFLVPNCRLDVLLIKRCLSRSTTSFGRRNPLFCGLVILVPIQPCRQWLKISRVILDFKYLSLCECSASILLN